jgi:hypothetical protein
MQTQVQKLQFCSSFFWPASRPASIMQPFHSSPSALQDVNPSILGPSCGLPATEKFCRPILCVLSALQGKYFGSVFSMVQPTRVLIMSLGTAHGINVSLLMAQVASHAYHVCPGWRRGFATWRAESGYPSSLSHGTLEYIATLGNGQFSVIYHITNSAFSVISSADFCH